MKNEYEDFNNSLDTLVDEIIARVEEVGLEQASEEYWEKAKRDLDSLCLRIKAHRERNNIPESEL